MTVREVNIKAAAFPIVDWLVLTGMARSKSKAKRLVSQGAVYCYRDYGSPEEVKERLCQGDRVCDQDIIKCGRRWVKAVASDAPTLKVLVCDFQSPEEERHWLETETPFDEATIERYMKEDWG